MPPPQHLQHARQAFLAGDFDRAQALSRQILLQDPYCAEPWFCLGLVADETGNPAEAEGCYRLALALEPRFLGGDALWYKSYRRLDEGWPRRAAEVARECGCGDSSGGYRVVQRLEARAQQDRELKERLTSLRNRLSDVRSCL